MSNSIKQKIQAGAKIVDVRTVDEWNDGHYPGAIHIPVAVLSVRLQDVGPKNHPVIVYCASGGRSAMAAQILKSNGYTDVTNAGGLSDMPD